jgi:methylmalonyl-CoA mutase
MKRKDFSNLIIQTQHEKISYFEHEDFIAGTAPFLRGIEATQFLKKPLITQLLVNFSAPKKSNTFIKEHISAGYKAIILDINTSPKATSGILIESVEDMKFLLEGISLNKLSITLTTKNAILTVLALFIAATKQLGIAQESLNLSINYNYKNALINTKFHQNILESILKYSKKHLSNFNTISISAVQPNNKTVETELTYFLAEAYENITNCISKGMLIDTIAPKISFNCTIEDDHFLEISKMRAARLLWAKMMYQFNPKQQQSLALQIHALQNFSNYHKVLSAILGGAQSVISNKNTSLLIENETAITKTVDPWAGSTFVEKTTEEISKNTWILFNELLNNGGFSKNVNLTLETEQQKEISLALIIEAAEKNASIEVLNSFYY